MSFTTDEPDDYNVFAMINRFQLSYIVEDKYYESFMSFSRVLVHEGILRRVYRVSEIDLARNFHEHVCKHLQIDP
jgi:hypothetical protein